MKRFIRRVLVGVLATASIPCSAVQLMRWERLPLAVPLVVGRERVVFVDRNVRVRVPSSVGDRLRVQSAAGAVYLRASEPMSSTRLELQDVDSGRLVLLDIVAEPAKAGQSALEPIRIVDSDSTSDPNDDDHGHATSASRSETPIAVVLTRYAAQSLYAPLRTVEPVPGVIRANLRRDLALDTMLPTQPVHLRAFTAWRLDDEWVTAVQLTNTSTHEVDLDPRELQADLVAATFQHPTLGPAGQSTDTTVAYLVTRGHGLAESLPPAVAPIDPSVNLPQPKATDEVPARAAP
jgi:integrating conjugative element protein (TIGR03749 family)